MNKVYLVMTGKMYMVATPIGNLEDITYRAVSVLAQVDLVLAEDTRVASKIMSHFSLDTSVIRFDQHSFRSEMKRLEILNHLMQGKDIALVSDAGTPGISDPGNELIDWLHNQNSEIEFIPVPGSSSVTAALSVCGFDVSNYAFVGFLPKKKRSAIFEKIKSLGMPVVFFESPFRINKTLEEFKHEFGENSQLYLGRELTKMHEEHFRGNVKEVLHAIEAKQSVKGEFVGILKVV